MGRDCINVRSTTFTDFYIYRRMVPLLSDPDFLFQGQIFKCLHLGNGESYLKNSSYGFCRFWYLPLNCAIHKVVICDVGHLFQGHIIQLLMSQKRWELEPKISNTTFIDMSSIGAIAKVVLIDPDPQFQSQLKIVNKLFLQMSMHLYDPPPSSCCCLLLDSAYTQVGKVGND